MAYLTVTTAVDVVAPGDGKLSLREALAQANGAGGPDTIRFSASVLGQTLVLTGSELAITDDMTIDGNNGGAAAQTTIDANKASRVLTITGNGTEVALNGLVVTNGSTNDEPGGGIFLGSDASLALADTMVINNDTGDGSGDHYYVADGGGIFADRRARLTVNRSTISHNIVADYYTGANGGGIRAAGNNIVTIVDSSITGNEGRFGGGISLGSGANISLLHATISGNVASTRRYSGSGGLYIIGGVANITNSSIVGNYGGDPGGGGILAESSIINVDNSTISNNSVGSRYAASGGGILNYGTANITNSTITGNTSDQYWAEFEEGGGVSNSGRLTINNSIIAGNFQSDFTIGKSPSDIVGSITASNGHNVFGSDVVGNIAGDRENIPPAALFAAVDPVTGGGKLGPDGTVALRNNAANPALSAADPISASGSSLT